MISRFGNKNFLAAHYDWLVLAAGVVVLAVGVLVYVASLGEDAEESAAAEVQRLRRMKPSATGVKPVDMTELKATFRLAKNPVRVSDVPVDAESFLASERRVLCAKCRKAIPGDVKLCPACPFCGEKQLVEAKVVLDADSDGLPDEWEKKYGLNPNDPADANADADGDDFTNLEEFAAKTDPKDRNDHPDYLDSLSIQLPLKKTYLPFLFTAANKIPTGWRCEFFDPKQRDNYNRLGRTFTAVIGEEIGKKDDRDPKKSVMTGFVATAYEKKSEEIPIKGAGTGVKGSGKTLMKKVDASVVHLKRILDGKPVTVRINQKNVAVDLHVDLFFSRGGGKKFTVTPGDEIALYNRKYKIVEFGGAPNAPTVVVEDLLSKKRKEFRKP